MSRHPVFCVGASTVSSKRNPLMWPPALDFGKGGAWGAVELGTRISYTDLDNGDIHGGKLGLLMGELNWYLNSHVRWMFNAGGGHVSGAHDGNIALFQTRVGIDF